MRLKDGEAAEENSENEDGADNENHQQNKNSHSALKGLSREISQADNTPPVFESVDGSHNGEEDVFLHAHPFNRGILDFDDFNYELIETISKQFRCRKIMEKIDIHKQNNSSRDGRPRAGESHSQEARELEGKTDTLDGPPMGQEIEADPQV